MFALAATIANRPSPCLFADSAEDSLKEIFGRLWELLNGTPSLRSVLPPEHLQSKTLIETRVATIFGGWATAPRTAADRACRIVVCNEADKMKPPSTRTEADYRLAVRNRVRGFKRSKILTASTPSVKGLSYVEGRALDGDQRRRKVPCPRCGHAQELRTGNGKDRGGIRFEKLNNGKLNAQKAFETAWYECELCGGRIEESERFRMCNAGWWVPLGCHVVDGELTGEPIRKGPHASFMELHALNNLLDGISINSEAKEYVEALTNHDRTEAIRSWTNDHEGRAWDPAPSSEVVSEIQGYMGADRPLNVVPEWARFLTFGADVGGFKMVDPVTKTLRSDYQFHWWVSAWGPGRRGGLVAIGDCFGKAAFLEFLQNAKFACPSKGGHYKLALSVVDSGYHSTAMYELCDSTKSGGKLLVIPIKGSSKDDGKDFANDPSDARMAYGGFRGTMPEWRKRLIQRIVSTGGKVASQYDLTFVSTTQTQLWVEERINGRIRQDDASYYDVPNELFSGVLLEQFELPLQMAGDYCIDGTWKKRRKRQDHRDSWRYSRAAAEIYTEGDWDDPTDTLISDSVGVRDSLADTESRGISGLGGRSFLASDRDID